MFKKLFGYVLMAVGLLLVIMFGLFFWRRAKKPTIAGSNVSATEAQVINPPSPTPVMQQTPAQVKVDPVKSITDGLGALPGFISQLSGIKDGVSDLLHLPH